MALREFWILVSYFLVALRRALTVAWIRLNKFLSSSDWMVRPVTTYRHKVVLIGDGFAEGLGDWVVMGGMAGVARQLERQAGTDEKVRMFWQIINRGRSGSVSADWLPSDEKSLYHKKVTRSSACKDAEIFVVTLGTMDVVGDCVGMPIAAMRKTAQDNFDEEETCDTVKNVREICEALRAEGKKVVVCNAMTSGAGVNRRAGLAKRLNRQLALYAKETASLDSKKKRTQPGGGRGGDPAPAVREPVHFVKLNNPRAMRDDGRAFDGLHLNSRGYRAFADALYDALGPMMVSVEWGFWKAKLAGGLTVGAGGIGGGGGAVVAPEPGGGGVEPKSKASKKAD
eukprot:jgi/Undpi1/1303/HiC_scaffold_11.g04695.m1